MPLKYQCQKWFLSLGSNTHVANAREWFVDDSFTDFDSYVGKPPRAMEVKGVGRVELNLCGDEAHKLILENVLFV
jgi:hypothetical protein